MDTQRTAAAADVFDDHRAEQRFDLLHPWPGEGVECATRRKWNHEPDRSRRIGFRAGNAPDGRKRGGARGQMQKLPSVGKFHFGAPFTSFDHLVSVVVISRPSAFAAFRLRTI